MNHNVPACFTLRCFIISGLTEEMKQTSSTGQKHMNMNIKTLDNNSQIINLNFFNGTLGKENYFVFVEIRIYSVFCFMSTLKKWLNIPEYFLWKDAVDFSFS